ncbi:MAG: hypothetical protein GY713_07445, partial [Actinomycetia bacterium]|nr:hypothetical protein [Actinomycetes bacterium]
MEQHDGPASARFEPVLLKGNTALGSLGEAGASEALGRAAAGAPTGSCTYWGIPFEVRRAMLVRDEVVNLSLDGVRAEWLVFLHTTDVKPRETDTDGFVSPNRGEGSLNEHVADYVVEYANGSEVRQPIRRRHQVGMFRRTWGENCFEAVPMHKPHPVHAAHEQPLRPGSVPLSWGFSQTRALNPDRARWMAWLYAWANPHPRRPIKSLRIEPHAGTLVVCGVSAGRATSHPLRWETRRKALLRLPGGEQFDFDLDQDGLLEDIRLDLGQVISAQPHLDYPNHEWAKTRNNQVPSLDLRHLVIEYAAHPDACFHLRSGKTVPVARLASGRTSNGLRPIAPATQRVRLRVLDAESKQPVPVKLHVHGEAGEYLPPTDRHRIPNPKWFEDYGADYVALDTSERSSHLSTYIPGETVIDLPIGRVYLEISKGFEVRPLRKVVEVKPSTRTMTVRLKKVLPWRERGWVTADTHVHFLSPKTAQLEGAAEGVNVINL